MMPSNIEREHIIKAIREIDSNGIPLGRKSRSFYLIFEGKQYPPKYALSLANKFANGEKLDSSRFSGGQETNSFLKSLGFDVVEISSSRTIGKSISSQKKTFERTQKGHGRLSSLVTTVIIQSNGKYSNEERLKVLYSTPPQISLSQNSETEV